MSADVSCRIAWADDAPAIAAVQVRSWRASYADLLPADLLAGLDAADLEQGWRASLSKPADARNRVLVALERNLVCGFTVTGPGSDPDLDPVAAGELGELVVDPKKRRAGHGSRLLQAGIDTLKADRFTRAVTWVAASDDETRRFLTEAGWAADGAHRTLDLTGEGEVQVKQVRLHCDIA